MLGRWYGLQGEHEARKEALLKQVTLRQRDERAAEADLQASLSLSSLTLSVSSPSCKVRGLTTTSFKSDETRFRSMALASLHLCRAHVDIFRSSLSADSAEQQQAPPRASSSLRDLAAARMHLRGVLKQCEDNFASHALFLEMQALLGEVVALEQQQQAAV